MGHPTITGFALLFAILVIVSIIAYFSPTNLEYLMSIGIVIAFVGLIFSVVVGRREIIAELRSAKLSLVYILFSLIILFIFLSIVISVVQPEQYLLFDDATYQAMATSILHTGAAWYCVYGTPTNCFINQVYIEPIGESFNIAIGFALFGVSRNIAYGVQIFLSCIAVLMTFFSALLLFRNTKTALFSELLIALSPTLLIWARPTTSDLPFLTYSLLLLFFFLLFIRRKNAKTFAMLAFSAALVLYMRIDATLLLVILFIGYFLLSQEGFRKTVKESLKSIRNSFATQSAVPLILMLFFVAVTPELFYIAVQPSVAYIAYGSAVPNTCNSSPPSIGTLSPFGWNFFLDNICANVYFWFNAYQNQFVMQPIAFTVLAILGAIFMFLLHKRKELLFIALWFVAFFLLYTFFYAGAATWDTNWRFQLSLIPQASLLGGFACSAIITRVEKISKKIGRVAKNLNYTKVILGVAYIALLTIIFASIYVLLPTLGLSFSNNPYGGFAFYYENFVINESHLIPPNCVVYTYDPSQFYLQNRSALQLSYIFDSTMYYDNVSQRYSCRVVDYGFFCTGNVGGWGCPIINTTVTLKPLYTSVYNQTNQTFGFYYIVNYTNGTT